MKATNQILFYDLAVESGPGPRGGPWPQRGGGRGAGRDNDDSIPDVVSVIKGGFAVVLGGIKGEGAGSSSPLRLSIYSHSEDRI